MPGLTSAWSPAWINQPGQVRYLCSEVRLLLSTHLSLQELAPLVLWCWCRCIQCRVLLMCLAACVTRQPVIHCLKCQQGLWGWILWWRQWFLTGKLWQARQWTACCMEQSGGVEICCCWAVWGHIITADDNSQLGACRPNMWQVKREEPKL